MTSDSAILACGLTAAAVILPGPMLIHRLSTRFSERIDSASPELNQLHGGKAGTPTMGGLLIIAAFCLGLLSLPVSVSGNPHRPVLLLTVCSFGIAGAVDDWIKARTRRRGLAIRTKFLLQLLLAVPTGYAVAMFRLQLAPALTELSAAGFLRIAAETAWCSFVILATCNAVNLTDGLDGLATGVVALISFTMAGVVLINTATLEIAAPLVLLGTACLSFLKFNRFPALLFMGDTGSLAIGALLATLCLLSKQEVALPCCGLALVLETVSVIAQVIWFRRTGERLLKCSPLHNHFVFLRIPEQQIVRKFWLLTAVADLVTVGFAALI